MYNTFTGEQTKQVLSLKKIADAVKKFFFAYNFHQEITHGPQFQFPFKINTKLSVSGQSGNRILIR